MVLLWSCYVCLYGLLPVWLFLYASKLFLYVCVPLCSYMMVFWLVVSESTFSFTIFLEYTLFLEFLDKLHKSRMGYFLLIRDG